MDKTENAHFIASRVTQLDAEDYDNYLYSLLFSQLKTVLNQAGDLLNRIRDYEPEIQLLVKLYIYRHTVVRNQTSIGQKSLSLKYHDAVSYGTVKEKQLWALAFSTMVVPYVHKRFSKRIISHKNCDRVDTAIKAANLLNFIVFLTRGTHRSLSERFLKVTCGYESLAVALNPVNYDYMNRELLWFTLAEFSSFALPLINLRRLQNSVRKWFNGPVTSPLAADRRTEADLKSCAICEQSPTNVREIGCVHIFCYYCVASSLAADRTNGFTCPKCNFTVMDDSDIRFFKLEAF